MTSLVVVGAALVFLAGEDVVEVFFEVVSVDFLGLCRAKIKTKKITIKKLLGIRRSTHCLIAKI